MFPHRDSRLTRFALFIFFLLILVYGLYEAQGLLFGPRIKIATNTTVVHDPYVKIEGQALRITSLSMNGKDIPVTETGQFSEPFLLATGDNRITLEAKDTYGRTTASQVDILYVPEEQSTTTLPQESSTTSNPLQ